jgi:hypothetical protein
VMLRGGPETHQVTYRETCVIAKAGNHGVSPFE